MSRAIQREVASCSANAKLAIDVRDVREFGVALCDGSRCKWSRVHLEVERGLVVVEVDASTPENAQWHRVAFGVSNIGVGDAQMLRRGVQRHGCDEASAERR